jgi:hypothetical protein
VGDAGPPFAPLGFVEVRFSFPGGGFGETKSGGTFDFRGKDCARALADVVLFAQGKRRTTDGRSLAELCGEVIPLPGNVGLIGWSNGGNVCMVCAGLFGAEFPDLAFYASHESPLGEGAQEALLGDHRTGRVNPAYDPDTGRLDLTKLAYAAEAPVATFGPPSGLTGSLFFDVDGDGKLGNADFPAAALVRDLGDWPQAYYAPSLLRYAKEHRLLAHWPGHVSTVEGSEAFWQDRDGARHLEAAARNCPRLKVIVYAGATDHVQIAPDHPHILAQYEGLRTAGLKFVRLNPDRCYAEPLIPGGTPSPKDNPANRPFDHTTIRDALEPDGIADQFVFLAAAVMELADRAQARNEAPDLERLLFPDAPSRLLRPPGRPGARDRGPR